MKQERRRKSINTYIALLHIIGNSKTPKENRLITILDQKKPKFILGFEPGLLRQNAIAQPLGPLPLPKH